MQFPQTTIVSNKISSRIKIVSKFTTAELSRSTETFCLVTSATPLMLICRVSQNKVQLHYLHTPPRTAAFRALGARGSDGYDYTNPFPLLTASKHIITTQCNSNVAFHAKFIMADPC